MTLDLFSEVALPSSIEEKGSNRPIAEKNTAQNATNNVAPTVCHPPALPLASVLRPTHFSHPSANRHARLITPAGKRMGENGGECIVAYEFRRAKRKTIGFVISSDGLRVSAPRWVPLYEVDKALQEKAAWIIAKLGQAQERQQKAAAAQMQCKDGEIFPFLGQPLKLVLDPSQAGSNHIHAERVQAELRIGLPHDASAQRIRDAVQAWLMRQAQQLFQERMHHFAPQLGVRWTKLSLSNAQGRWGSASSAGAIRLNWRLIHHRISVIDYVVVHELSHLRVMDHSPRFWSTVQSVMPDYALRKNELKDEAIPRW